MNYLNTLGQRYDDKGANKTACWERGKTHFMYIKI